MTFQLPASPWRVNATPGIRYEVFDGTHLPFADRSFDAAFAINVFHHVPVAQRPALVADVRRVLRPGGLFAIFEHNPLNPVTRRIVNTCEFDKDAVLLKRRDSETLLEGAGFSDISTRYIFSVPAAGLSAAALIGCFLCCPSERNITRSVPANRAAACLSS